MTAPDLSALETLDPNSDSDSDGGGGGGAPAFLSRSYSGEGVQRSRSSGRSLFRSLSSFRGAKTLKALGKGKSGSVRGKGGALGAFGGEEALDLPMFVDVDISDLFAWNRPWLFALVMDVVQLMNCFYTALLVMSFFNIAAHHDNTAVEVILMLTPSLVLTTVVFPSAIRDFTLVKAVAVASPEAIELVMQRMETVVSMRDAALDTIVGRITLAHGQVNEGTALSFFNEVDRDQRGYIEPEELRDVLARLGLTLTSHMFRRLLCALDLEDCHHMQFADFFAFLQKHDPRPKEDTIDSVRERLAESQKLVFQMRRQLTESKIELERLRLNGIRSRSSSRSGLSPLAVAPLEAKVDGLPPLSLDGAGRNSCSPLASPLAQAAEKVSGAAQKVGDGEAQGGGEEVPARRLSLTATSSLDVPQRRGLQLKPMEGSSRSLASQTSGESKEGAAKEE